MAKKRKETVPRPEGSSPAQAAAVWLALAAIELVCLAAIPGTAVHDASLGVWARISLTAYALGVLAAGVLCVLALTALIRWATPAGAPRLAHIVGAGARGAIVWTASLLYFTSWAAYWNVGLFLDREALAFWTPHPVQVFHWVYPPVAAAVLVVTSLVAIAVGYGLPRQVASWSRSSKQLVTRSAIVLLVGCVLVAPLPNGSGLSYASARDQRLTPVARVIGDATAIPAAAPVTPAATASSDERVITRPIISMDEYLRTTRERPHKPFNVVMVQIESLRSDQLPIYGGERNAMPTVNTLAGESRVFTNAYVQASHSNYTDPVPLSSHYPLRSAQAYSYPPNPTYPRVLIYDILKALGYKTAVFSSQNEFWSGMVNFHQAANLDRFFHAATFSGPTYTPWEDVGFAKWVAETRGAGSVDDAHTMAAAMEWIDGTAGQPFFLHMNLQSSHLPYVVPKGFKRPFGQDEIDFAIMWANYPRDKVDVVKARYADSLFYEDLQIRKLIDRLKARGVWDRTLMIIGGDNGEAFYEHGFAAHAGALVNTVMKVPMIIRVPGMGHALDDRPAMFLDIPPTILDAMGLPPHPSFQGISLFAANPDRTRSIYMIVQTPVAYQSAIVRDGMKLIHDERQQLHGLFDLVRDPGERDDIVKSRPELVRDLNERLQFWRAVQLSYYADVSRHRREYPPIVR